MTEKPRAEPSHLRARTYLSPGLPRELFERVCGELASALGVRVSLTCDDRSSGPMAGHHDPFAAGEVDIGFVCSPSYLWLTERSTPSVELVPAGFAFADPRHGGAPVYASEVVVRDDHPASSFADLRGAVWGFNDECSLSGHVSTLLALSELGCGEEFFRDRVRTGSHHASLDGILEGRLDGAAIDSTVLALWRRARPEAASKVRVVEAWGPFPIQPIVVRKDLGDGLAGRIAEVLLGREPGQAEWREAFALERFVPLSDADYAAERRALRTIGLLPRRERSLR